MITRTNATAWLLAVVVSIVMWYGIIKLGEYVWFHFQKTIVIELAEEIKREGL